MIHSPAYYRFVPGIELWPFVWYDTIAKGCSDTDILVEVGVGFGRSTCLMTELLAAENKHPKLYAIDLFGTNPDPADQWEAPATTPWGEPFADWSKRVGGDWRLIDSFDFYMAQNPARDRLTDRVQFPPWHSAEEFDDGSVYFVMLNASRRFEPVLKQIQAWAPKCAAHGKGIAVYGADVPEVVQAVQAFCGNLGMTYRVEDNALILVTNVPPERLKPAPVS